MDTIDIQYQFHFNDGTSTAVNLQLDAESLEMLPPDDQVIPDWAALEFCQCSHCPLSKQDSEHCPVAVNLVSVADIFNKILSYEELVVEVSTAERTVRQSSTAQKSVSSLIGLLMGASACPHTAFFKSMARHHLPLASQDETIYRAASAYLLAQYFKQNGKGEISFDGLNQIYENIHTINVEVAKRLRSATQADSTLNAIAILDMNAQILPLVIEDSLEDIRFMFEPYLHKQPPL